MRPEQMAEAAQVCKMPSSLLSDICEWFSEGSQANDDSNNSIKQATVEARVRQVGEARQEGHLNASEAPVGAKIMIVGGPDDDDEQDRVVVYWRKLQLSRHLSTFQPSRPTV